MFRRILVPLDTSAFAAAAVAPAVTIARETGAEVDFILVHEAAVAIPDGAELVEEAQRAEEEAYIARFMNPLVDQLAGEGIHGEVVLRHGRAADAIIAFAEARESDLVVIASHGRTGLGRAVLGSLADRLMHELSCPILMVRPDQPALSTPRVAADRPFRRIVVLLDGSPEAERVIRDAEVMAQSRDATLILLRVVRPVTAIVGEVALPELMLGSMLDDDGTSAAVLEAEGYLSHLAGEIRRRGPINVETDVHLATDASAVLPGLVRSYRADLVAMTTHGRGASRLILGSVTDAVLRGTECAVLLRRRMVAPVRIEPRLVMQELVSAGAVG